MQFSLEEFRAELKDLDIKNLVPVRVSDIIFSDQVRKYCEQNSCGQYGRNWACPPGVGPVSELKEKAGRFKHGFIVQTVHTLKNSFDLKGMMEDKKVHDRVMREVCNRAREKGLADFMCLSAGHCEICSTCTYQEGAPCRFPEKAMSSLEAYGIDVVRLAKDHGFPYHHGTGTVSYVGLVLYNL